jgi:MFS family permease
MPLYLCIVAGFDSTSAGFLLLPTTAVVALSSPVVGAWVDRYGAAWPMAVGLMLMALSAGLQMQFVAETNIALVILAFAVMGLGWGCILGPATVIALASVPARFSGSAMGASWTLHNVGGALGLVLSTLTYRLSAARALDVDPRLPGPADPLLVAALVSEPTTAVRKLAGLGSGMTEAEAIVDAFFMAGYHAVMGLLFVVMLLALVAIAGLRRMAARMT